MQAELEDKGSDIVLNNANLPATTFGDYVDVAYERF